jgi:hypothetical protein
MSSKRVGGWRRPDVRRRRPVEWEETQLYHIHKERVREGRPNDFVLAISASSKTGVSGTGKTTAACALAEEFDILDGQWDADRYGTTEVDELAYDILPEAEEGAAMLLEEAQGTPSGTGLNKRRGMKEETLGAINGILANRDNRNTVIIVVQQLSMLDMSLIPLLDAWLLIRYEPSDPQGPMMVHHGVEDADYDLNGVDLKTPGREELEWPPLEHKESYRTMERKKQSSKRRPVEDSEPSLPRGAMSKDERDELITELYEEDGVSQKQLSQAFDLAQPQISRIVNGKG